MRPGAEYAAGHIPGAVIVPHDQHAARLAELPTGINIVAYCRGRYCVFAPDAYVCCGRGAFPPGRSTGAARLAAGRAAGHRRSQRLTP